MENISLNKNVPVLYSGKAMVSTLEAQEWNDDFLETSFTSLKRIHCCSVCTNQKSKKRQLILFPKQCRQRPSPPTLRSIRSLLTSRRNVGVLLLQFPLLLHCCQLTSLLLALQELLPLHLLLLDLLAVLLRLLVLLHLRLPTEAQHSAMKLWQTVSCFWTIPHSSPVLAFTYCCQAKSIA